MTRKKHEVETRNKILKTARRLFMEQGYHKTTIREIVAKCDVKIGTLYHFFKNKEEIFLHIVKTLLDRVVIKADEQTPASNICLRFAREIRLHLKIILHDANSRELYLVAYQSLTISSLVLDKRIERGRKLFARYNPQFSQSDYMGLSLFVEGVLHAIAIDRTNSPDKSMEYLIPMTINNLLRIYNVPLDEIEATMAALNSARYIMN